MMFSSRRFDASRRLLWRVGLILMAVVLGSGAGVQWLAFGPAPAGAAPTGIANLPSDPLVRARMLVRRGDAKGALALLDPALQDPATADEARLIALEAAVLSGRSDLVQHLQGEAGPESDPRVIAALAEALRGLGDETAARALLDDGLRAHAKSPAATAAPLHVALGRLFEARGERADARASYTKVPPPAEGSAAPDSAAAGSTVPSRSAVATADQITAAAYGARGRGEFQEAKNAFEHALRVDPGNTAARLGLASLFLEKHETQLARSTLSQLLGANPQHAAAQLLLARTFFADGRHRDAEAACQAILDLEADHPGALELMAMLDLADEDVDGARQRIEQGLARAPGQRSLLALRATTVQLKGDMTAAERERAAILAEAPHYADVHAIAGGVLDRLRRYPECAVAYRAALALDPEHAQAANALGLSYMRDGQEEEAKEWLDRGFALDPFNIRTYNMRLLVDKLAGYKRFETEHFVIKLDEPDLAFAPLLAPYLEKVYADLCPRFGFTPERKTTVEVFPEKDLLSARLIGLPGIEGIPAACFGSVIAMDSPRLWKGNINWQTVLRHEFGHVLALTRTAKQVPFWFTEGLSVVLEDQAPTLASDRIARWALAEDELIPFTALNHGFTRPKTMMQRSLAYYQSAFAVRRLIDRHGFDAALGMLDEYAAGRTNAVAIERRLGTSEAAWAQDVDQAIRAHVEILPVWALPSRERLVERVTEASTKRGDLEARTRMAEEWFQAGELETAVSEALAVLEADSSQVRARILLGHALLVQGDPFAAADYLTPLADREPLDYLVARDLGIIYAAQGEDEAARAYLEYAIQIYPTDPEPYRKLADVHRESGRMREAIAALDDAAKVADDPFVDLIALADLAAASKLLAEEADALAKSLALRPFEPAPVKRLAKLERDAGHSAEAVRYYEVLCLLEPKNVEAHATLVEMALEHGPREVARRYAPRLAELDPGNTVARRALERL